MARNQVFGTNVTQHIYIYIYRADDLYLCVCNREQACRYVILLKLGFILGFQQNLQLGICYLFEKLKAGKIYLFTYRNDYFTNFMIRI